MKSIFPRVLTVLLAVAFATTSLQAAESRETKRLEAGKITKNEAQHLVLKKFPRATIRKCELKGTPGHSFWMVEVIRPGHKAVRTVRVDGRTGKLMR